jgi:4-amino-4-deoxy-L-arabinose transferase-like glycosyltransferase
MTWTVLAILALIDGIQTSVAEWRLRHASSKKRKPGRPGDAFPEFLVLWALIPIIFFSFSQSKLPGYVLPSIPPITILTGDYLFRRRTMGLNRWELAGHAALSGLMTMFALLLPWFVAHGAHLPPARPLVAAFLAAWGGLVYCDRGQRVRGGAVAPGYLGVLVVLVVFIYGVGPFFGLPSTQPNA